MSSRVYRALTDDGLGFDFRGRRVRYREEPPELAIRSAFRSFSDVADDGDRCAAQLRFEVALRAHVARSRRHEMQRTFLGLETNSRHR